MDAFRSDATLAPMNGELAQIMAIASHGSAWLHRPDTDPPRLELESSTFRFVRSVSFVAPGGSAVAGSQAVDGVAPWLLMLRDRGVERLRLIARSADGALPDPIAAAFAGGGGWGLVTVGASPALWRAAWTVGDRKAPDQRIWDVRYTGVAIPPTAIPSGPPVDVARQRLVEALAAAQAFARQQALDFWTDYFAKALDLQHAAQPEPPYHPDLLPARGYDDASRRLVAMAGQAWVFGGMGSWNDLAFPTPADNDRYKQVTHELYDAVLDAAVAAVNADPAT